MSGDNRTGILSSSAIPVEKKAKKKKVSSTRNAKVELKEEQMIQLLARFEGELQGKEIALAALRAEQAKMLVFNYQDRCFSSHTDPLGTLLRDGMWTKDNGSQPMQHFYEKQVLRLKELIDQQKKHIQTLKEALTDVQRRFSALNEEVEHEKQEKLRVQAFQTDLSSAEEDRDQLRNELNDTQTHNKELGEQLSQIMKLLEQQHERHKRFLVLLLNERQLKNRHHQEQVKQLSMHRLQSDREEKEKMKALQMENERNQQVLTARVQQLQNEIDALLQEKTRTSKHSAFRAPTPKLPRSPSTSTSTVNELSPPPSVEKTPLSLTKTSSDAEIRPTLPTPSSSPLVAKRLMKREHLDTVEQVIQGSPVDDLQRLLGTLRQVAENRLKEPSVSTSPDLAVFRAAETGDAAQLLQFLRTGSNPNRQLNDGNTCLHLSTAHGHVQCIGHLLQHGANPSLENHLGITSWKNLSQLNEPLQLECLREFLNQGQKTPAIDLLVGTIEHNYLKIFDYLLPLLREQLRNNAASLSRLLKTALRSSNTHFLASLISLIESRDLIPLIDRNTFISTECLTVLTHLEHPDDVHLKPIDLIVCVSSSDRVHRFSYAIGKISLTSETTWLELERSCVKVFLDHITQLNAPFDCPKSSIGYSATIIQTLTFGQTRWHYQDSPSDQSSLPFKIGQEEKSITIHLKGFEANAMDALAYNYLIPSQNLKNFIRYIEQNLYVGVYGAAYLQKKSLFDDLMKYLERPVPFPSSPKFRVIRLEIELVTSLDDLIEELIEQEFFHTDPSSIRNVESPKMLLYFANIQNAIGFEMLDLLLKNEHCQQISLDRGDSPMTYHFPSRFHVFITLSKRVWSTENEIYKRFKWIPFKIDSVPWNGLLKRHLWRRMTDTNLRDNRPIENELISTVQWISNVWQRYNECLQKLSLQDALLGPALFFDCPMDREAIFEWLQIKWNTIIAPLVRDFSMSKCAPSKSKTVSSAAANNSYESVAGTALYVLLHRAVSRDCPLMGQERDQYLLNFVGSRFEGSTSLNSSAASSRTGTPQPSGSLDFV